ncbi:Plasmodium exported protein (hyp15), unknown function [Plasmodium sp.]|nr:Plasmodium exported protein (hyp15), unknown function [Plasmodium sp.]
MHLFYVKIFSLLFILRICEVIHTSDINILKYKREKHVSVKKLKFVRSLCEVFREQNLKTEITECDLIYDILEKDTLLKNNNLINNTEIDDYNKRNKKREKKLQDKIIRQETKDYNKSRDKLDIDKSFGTSEYNVIIEHIKKKNRIVDKLYKIIFKGKVFWKILSYTMDMLGIASTVCFLTGIIFACCQTMAWVPLLFGVWGVCVFLLIILIVGVWFLTTLLWPHKDTYNKKYGV